MSDPIAPATLNAEEQQQALTRLRFPDALEADFRQDFEASAPKARMTLQMLAVLLIGVTPLYDVSLLHAPHGFVAASRMLQFGVAIPFVLLSLLVTAVPRLRSFSPAATVLAGIVVASCLMAQRVIGHDYGFTVPQAFPAITFTAVLFFGHLRLITIAPAALLTMIGTTIIGLETFDDAAAIYGAISNWMLFTISVTGAYLLEYSSRQSWHRGHLLTYQASHDALTGLLNRRQFDLELRALVRDAARQRKSVALMVLDIDHFKAFNDHYGHPLGDECLRRVGTRLRVAMRRPRDFCARIGGEEFVAVWFDARADDAIRMAEALRCGIQEMGIPPAPGFGDAVTSSAGFVQLAVPNAADTTNRICVELMKAADAALYEAKRAGRARTVNARGGLASVSTASPAAKVDAPAQAG